MATPNSATDGHFKDAILAGLAEHANVAQFVSFSPGIPERRFAVMHDAQLSGVRTEEAIEALLTRAPDGRVNVRSFLPEQPQSHDFIYGLSTTAEATAAVRRLAQQGLYTIVNETIDVNDGGVSGVSYGDIIEFAPKDTPRCVEKPGTASLSNQLCMSVLRAVYGFAPALPDDPTLRVEFSIHPIRRGHRHDHTIIWEVEQLPAVRLVPSLSWPNRFSELIGDKTFGLLIAHCIGCSVPMTTVVNRSVAPFTFGTPTGSREPWLRTAPTVQVPGRFTTRRGWVDPFTLLNDEDKTGTSIPSVLAQEGVAAEFSGAAAADESGGLLIEGVCGSGEAFMQGEAAPDDLPAIVVAAVNQAYSRIAATLGPARFEWVFDGEVAWIVQLHRGAVTSTSQVIVAGKARTEHRFLVTDGLEALRALVASLKGTGDGIVLVGRVGVTSHFGDVLRKAGIPSRIEEAA